MAKFARLLAAALLLVFPVQAFAKPPVWIVRDADSTIILFGSVHNLDQGRDWRPKALDEALAQADDVWFEIPMDEAARQRAQQAAMQRGLLPPGQTLSSLLAPRDRKRLAKAAETYRLPLAALDQLQPWLADITLTTAFLSAQGAAASDGVEEVLEHSAPATTPRRAFETPEEQINILAGASRKAQVSGLSDTLRSLNDDPKGFTRLLDLWMKGDVRGIDREAVAPLRKASPEMFDALITRRNQNWVGQIEQRLAGKGQTVIVVGAGHLTGPGGVPTLLRARGIKVEGP